MLNSSKPLDQFANGFHHFNQTDLSFKMRPQLTRLVQLFGQSQGTRDFWQLINIICKDNQQPLFQQHFQKVIPWDSLGSMPYIWVSEALDLTQMVMDIQKQLEITIFIIPNNFCLNKIAKKSFPGTLRGQCPTLGCRRLWTSPRWSWTYGNN